MQLASDTAYRGRVMSLWSISFNGTTPIGGPIVGAIAQDASPRWALGVGAIACGFATLVPLAVARRRRTTAVASRPGQ
jgi:MFS family permease